jgi:DNA-binding NarL/FixJ family response regulator
VEWNVAIVCELPMSRAGIERLIQDEPGFRVSASVGAVEELDGAGPVECQAVIVDLPAVVSRPALEVIGKLATIGAPLVCSSWDRPPSVLSAVRAGARGVITRYAQPAGVRQALRTVCDGGLYVGPDLVDRFLAELSRPAEIDENGLAPREVETLRWIALGYTHRQIATRMGLTPATVNTYAKRLRAKLKVNNKAELTRMAIELGHLANGRRAYSRS